MVRVNGDVTIPAGEAHGVVVVVDGDLDFKGTADTIVVVNGAANLTGATLATLVVVSGEANLGAGTTVTGDVRLVDSNLVQDPSATVADNITQGAGSEFFEGFWIVGLIFMIGWAVLVLLAGLLFAAVAPDLSRRTGRYVTADLGPTLIAALVLWVVVPVVPFIGPIVIAVSGFLGSGALALNAWHAVRTQPQPPAPTLDPDVATS